MSLRLYKQPLVVTYSGGKDSDVLLHLAEASGIPFEVLHEVEVALKVKPKPITRPPQSWRYVEK